MRKLGCLGLLIVLAAFIGLFVLVQDWGGRGPAPRNMTFEVAEGASLSGTADRLEKAGAIPSAARFKLLAKIFGSNEPIKAGEYRIPAHLSPADILKMLQGGKTLQRFVTIPEGLPAVMVKDRLMAADELVGTVEVPIEGTLCRVSPRWKL